MTDKTRHHRYVACAIVGGGRRVEPTSLGIFRWGGEALLNGFSKGLGSVFRLVNRFVLGFQETRRGKRRVQ